MAKRRGKCSCTSSPVSSERNISVRPQVICHRKPFISVSFRPTMIKIFYTETEEGLLQYISARPFFQKRSGWGLYRPRHDSGIKTANRRQVFKEISMFSPPTMHNLCGKIKKRKPAKMSGRKSIPHVFFQQSRRALSNIKLQWFQTTLLCQQKAKSIIWSKGNLRSGSIFVSLWKLHSGGHDETKREPQF